MPDVAMSEIRSERFAFNQEPALLSWSQIFERDGLGMLSLLDIDQKRVAVLQGSVQYDYLQELVRSFNMNVQWVILDTIEQAFIAVEDGRADAVVSNHFYGDQQALQMASPARLSSFNPFSCILRLQWVATLQYLSG